MKSASLVQRYFVTPCRKGICSEMRCVRLRCDFLKFIKKQMPHFTLFRTIGICFFINFENQHPRPKTANFRMSPFAAERNKRLPHISDSLNYLCADNFVVSFGNFAPVKDLEECLDVIGTKILVFKIICMLPNIECNNRDKPFALAYRIVLIGRC